MKLMVLALESHVGHGRLLSLSRPIHNCTACLLPLQFIKLRIQAVLPEPLLLGYLLAQNPSVALHCLQNKPKLPAKFNPFAVLFYSLVHWWTSWLLLPTWDLFPHLQARGWQAWITFIFQGKRWEFCFPKLTPSFPSVKNNLHISVSAPAPCP